MSLPVINPDACAINERTADGVSWAGAGFTSRTAAARGTGT